MLFRQDALAGIREGTTTMAFRSWKRPTVSAGGTLRTQVGVLAIDSVDEIQTEDITDADARAAGFESPGAVAATLRTGPDRCTFRIAFHRVGEDPRIALRNDGRLDDSARAEIRTTLDGWDRRSGDGPWTDATLQAIAHSPATLAADLAASLGVERAPFKRRVRRLKELGLTESLEVGYRLSARGESYLSP